MNGERDEHSPRSDNAMQQDGSRGGPDEERTQDQRQQTPGERIGPRPPGGTGLASQTDEETDEELDERTRLAALLVGARYPATGNEVLETARRNGADDDVVGRLSSLANSERFDSFEAVWAHAGGAR